MPRASRVIASGETYHLVSKGNDGQKTFRSRDDHLVFLMMLERVAMRYGWCVLAYCLMSNHYHLVVRAGDAGLSDGMRDLNGGFARWSNKRYGRSGHLWRNRFFSKHLDSDVAVILACRYVVLNPVRARVCRLAEEYAWSSYRATVGILRRRPFLFIDDVLAFFGRKRDDARRGYDAFIAEGVAELEATTSG